MPVDNTRAKVHMKKDMDLHTPLLLTKLSPVLRLNHS